MQKISFVFLLVFLSAHSVHAKCMSVDIATKCARIPSSGFDIVALGNHGDYTDGSWRFIRYYFINEEFTPGHYISGTSAALTAQTAGRDKFVTCHVSSPLLLTLSLIGDSFSSSNPYEICAQEVINSLECEISDISKLPGDQCPDGFYTVPYDIPCGEGFVDAANIPSCADDTSGEFCVIIDKLPCASGITKLNTSTGLSFQLWAEKYTTPSLNILYNGAICYVNLELGSATNAININNNGQIYHATN